MFFTNYYKDKLARLERKVAALSATIQAQDSVMEAHTELIRSFQKLQDQYSEGLARARQVQDELQAAIPTFSSTPLFKSEEEEDLEYRLDSGLLDPDEYREALEKAGLDPNIAIQR